MGGQGEHDLACFEERCQFPEPACRGVRHHEPDLVHLQRGAISRPRAIGPVRLERGLVGDFRLGARYRTEPIDAGGHVKVVPPKPAQLSELSQPLSEGLRHLRVIADGLRTICHGLHSRATAPTVRHELPPTTTPGSDVSGQRMSRLAISGIRVA